MENLKKGDWVLTPKRNMKAQVIELRLDKAKVSFDWLRALATDQDEWFDISELTKTDKPIYKL